MTPAEENGNSSAPESVDNEKTSSSENVTIVAETSTATMSSTKSEDSAQQLICKSPQTHAPRKNVVDTRSATLDSCYEEEPKAHESNVGSKSLDSDASSKDSRSAKSNAILYLGVIQLLVGVLMIVFGGLVIVHNASLSRVGSGLWSGCAAVVTGILGVLAGINDSYGLYDRRTSRKGSALLTAFLAMSLVSLAAANMAAVLAGTGIFRDVHRNEIEHEDQEILRKAWTPILSNVGFLMLSVLYCLVAIISIYQTSKRVCPCFRPKEAFNHNQFDASYTTLKAPCSLVTTSEKSKRDHPDNREDLNKTLEGKLRVEPDRIVPVKGPVRYYGTAASREKLVTNWLGGQPYIHVKNSPKYIKRMKMKPQPYYLVPANAGNTLGRPMAMPVCAGPPLRMGYATLPLLGSHPQRMPGPQMAPPYAPPIYYPFGDMARPRRRRNPRPAARGSPSGRRNHQLTRSLERIHRKLQRVDGSPTSRKHRGKRSVTEADVIRTYTGLDRTIADEFIAACAVTRSVNPHEKSDSSAFDTSSSTQSMHRPN